MTAAASRIPAAVTGSASGDRLRTRTPCAFSSRGSIPGWRATYHTTGTPRTMTTASARLFASVPSGSAVSDAVYVSTPWRRATCGTVTIVRPGPTSIARRSTTVPPAVTVSRTEAAAVAITATLTINCSPATTSCGATTSSTRTSLAPPGASGTAEISTPSPRASARASATPPRLSFPSVRRTIRLAPSGGSAASDARIAWPRSVPAAAGCVANASRGCGFGSSSVIAVAPNVTSPTRSPGRRRAAAERTNS